MSEPLDWAALRAHCAADEGLVAEVIELFRREVDGQVQDVARALLARNPEALQDAAHRLKGALVTLGAGPATERAIALERCGARNELPLAPALFAQLQQEIARLLTAIDEAAR